MLTLAAAPGGPAAAIAAPAESGGENADDQHSLYYGVHLPRERALSRGVTIAKQLLAERRYAESLPVLIRVLHAPEDAYPAYPSGERQPTSLKSEAAQLIGELPDEGKRAYQLEVRAQAERELADAARSGPRALREVVGRFPHTEASRLALWLLCQQAFERRDFEQCVVCLELLLAADISDAQREQVQAQLNLAKLAAAGQAPSDAAAIPPTLAMGLAPEHGDSHDQWLAAGGGPTRNPQHSTAPPHLWADWISYATGLPGWAAKASVGHSDAPRASAASPLVVGPWVVVRGHDGLAGIDRQTGKLVWRRQLPSADIDSPASQQLRRLQGDAVYLKRLLEDENRDAVNSRVSSDGRLVFAVASGSDTKSRTTGDAWSQFRGAGIVAEAGAENQILAIDALAEGKLKWRTTDQPELDGMFFLDCPMVLPGRLFVLGEQEQAICLVELDQETGRPLWRQTITTVESPVHEEAMRRMVGGSLAYADGLLVCSTGAGMVVAVDPLSRTLEWVYRFPVEGGVQLGRSSPWGRRGSDRWPREARRQWLWNQLLVHEGRLLVGSPESRMLHCIAIKSGEPLWSSGDSRPQLLCAARGDAVIVSREDAVVGLGLEDGAARWTTRLPSGAHPAGEGAWLKGGFLLPLSDGSAVVVELVDGSIASTMQVGPEGVMGNLAFDGQAVYSQSFTGVARFTAGGKPGGSLRHQAEIAAVAGDADQTIAKLVEGYRKEGSQSVFASRLREILADGALSSGADLPSESELAELYADRPTPMSVRLARLKSAAAARNADLVRRQAIAYCRSPQRGDLVAVDEELAACPTLLYRNAVEDLLAPAERIELARRLMRDAGPGQRELVLAVFGRAEKARLSAGANRGGVDRRWAVSQVAVNVRPRADRIRRRNGSRVSSHPNEFELPLLAGQDERSPPVGRLVASTLGQLSILNPLGEIAAQVDLAKSSPERMQRLASDGAPVAGRWRDWLFVSTGEDVAAIDTRRPEQGVAWTARRSLQQAAIRGDARGTARLHSFAQGAAQREVRLIGVSQRGVTVASRDLVACLDPATGRNLWIAVGLDTDGNPTADERFVYAAPTIRPGWRVSLATGARSELAPPAGERVASLRGRLAVLDREQQPALLTVFDRATGRPLLQREYDQSVQHTEQDGLLVLVDNTGRLEALSIVAADGGAPAVVLEDQLQLGSEVLSVVAEQVGAHLLVGVNHAAAHSHRAAGVTPIDHNAVMTGPLYCYRLDSGRPVWPGPVQVSAKAPLARQPERSPFVVLAAGVKARDATGRYDAVDLLLVDLFSGRTVHRETGPRDDKGLQYRIQLGEGARPTCTVALDEAYVVLTAEPHPVPPGPPANATVEQVQEGSLWKVGQALGKLLGEGLGGGEPDPSEAEDDD